jgi:hypothetical protein
MLALSALVAISGGRRDRPRAGRSSEQRRRGVSKLPSALRRAGAVACVCLFIGGAVTGCAWGKNSNSASTLAPATTSYKKAAALASNLASLGRVSGPINGTMTVGSDQLTLTGTVTLNGRDSQIGLVQSGQDQRTVDEIVLGGHRYSSPDGQLWIDRGAKAGGTSLAAVLAAADTKLDEGVTTVDGVKAHKILTAPDKVDVAPALGIDTWTFDEETTTLRVWADDAGKPLGFGASMSWKVTIGGAQEVVSTDLDAMFTYTSPDDITVPNAPWQWIQDNASGVAFGLPKGWSKSASSTAKFTNYSLPGTKNSLVYTHLDAGKETLDQAAQDVASSLTGKRTGPESTWLASEPARHLTNDSTQAGMYLTENVVLHETVGYIVAVGGSRTDKPAIDSLANQIFSTFEFTR